MVLQKWENQMEQKIQQWNGHSVLCALPWFSVAASMSLREPCPFKLVIWEILVVAHIALIIVTYA